jgi:hypothetical protein
MTNPQRGEIWFTQCPPTLRQKENARSSASQSTLETIIRALTLCWWFVKHVRPQRRCLYPFSARTGTDRVARATDGKGRRRYHHSQNLTRRRAGKAEAQFESNLRLGEESGIGHGVLALGGRSCMVTDDAPSRSNVEPAKPTEYVYAMKARRFHLDLKTLVFILSLAAVCYCQIQEPPKPTPSP